MNWGAAAVVCYGLLLVAVVEVLALESGVDGVALAASVGAMAAMVGGITGHHIGSRRMPPYRHMPTRHAARHHRR